MIPLYLAFVTSKPFPEADCAGIHLSSNADITAMTFDQISISRFSVITRISPKALRYYDRKGLLVPAAKDRLTGYRYYSSDQLDLGVKIKTLTLLEFDIDTIASYLQAEKRGDKARMNSILEMQKMLISQEISRMERIKELLQEGTEVLMKMVLISPVIKEVPALRVLAKREQGSIAETIHKLTEEIMATIRSPENQKHRAKVAGPFMVMYHGDEFDLEDADIEVAIPITGPIELNDSGVLAKRLPACRVLSAVHKGSHELLHITYKEMFNCLAQRGLEFQSPARELFLNSPHETQQEELLTEIQLPVKQ
jgi:effector-binding domain-containing protein